MGGFITLPAAKLSAIGIDVNKDWAGYIIKNLGAPVDANDSIRLADLNTHKTATTIDHPDGSVTTSKIADNAITPAKISLGNYCLKVANVPSVSGTLGGGSYFPPAFTKGFPLPLTYYIAPSAAHGWAIFNVSSISDGYIYVFMYQGNYAHICIRFSTTASSGYTALICVPAATADFKLYRTDNGTFTQLASEAVNLGTGDTIAGIRSVGTTIYGLRGSSATISATDSTYASGVAGIGSYDSYTVTLKAGFVAYHSPTTIDVPKSLAFFDIPVTGTGQGLDAFRPEMPEEIADDPVWGKVNRLSVTHSSLIRTDVEYRAIVRIIESDRQPSLRPLSSCLSVLKAKYKELTREEAIKEMLRIDDRLHKLDLMDFKEAGYSNEKTAVKEYISWRKSQFNVDMDEDLALMYIRVKKI